MPSSLRKNTHRPFNRGEIIRSYLVDEPSVPRRTVQDRFIPGNSRLVQRRGQRTANDLQRMIDYVKKGNRFGVHIKLNQLGNVPQNAQEQALFQELRLKRKQTEKQIEQAREDFEKAREEKKHGWHKKGNYYESLLTKRELLREVTNFVGRTGRKPTVFQVLAIEALKYGLNSSQLKNKVIKMNTLWCNHHFREWQGTSSGIHPALCSNPPNYPNLNFPSAIEKILHENPESLTSKELAEKLGIYWGDKRNKSLINTSLQLLHTLRLAKKLPVTVKGATKTPFAVSTHQSRKASLKDYQTEIGERGHYSSSSMEIINQLYFASGKKLSQNKLCKEMRLSGGGKSGSPEAKFVSSAIINMIRHLEKKGIVQKIEKISLIDKKGRIGKKVTQIALTPYGEYLWRRALETGEISNELSAVLLGEKNN